MKRLPYYIVAGVVLMGVTTWLALTGYHYGYQEPAEKQNFTFIEDGVSMGGSVEQPPKGTRAVLNLCEIEDPYQAEFHSWEKIPDAAPAPSLEWLRTRVAFVDEHRRAGHSTYVHCYAGVSRCGLVVVAYLMFKNKWTRDESLAYVREQRPQVRPNPAFMKLLLEYEKGIVPQRNDPTAK